MRTRHQTAALAATALLILAGCAAQSDESAEDVDPVETTEATTTADDQQDDTEAQSDDATPTSPDDTDDADDAETTSTEAHDDDLVLTTGAEEVVLEPTDVYCSGDEGNIRHIIGKTNNQLPIIEARGSEFAMVKTGPGAPHRADQPSGISYGDDSVTFADTDLGADVTLDGTMTCSVWED